MFGLIYNPVALKMFESNQVVLCHRTKMWHENSERDLFMKKEVGNERKVATIKSLREKNIFQGNERDFYTEKSGERQWLRVKTTQLIQFLPVQMLLLNPRNMGIAF